MDAQRRDDPQQQQSLDARLKLIAGEQQERLARIRAEQLELPYVALSVFPIDPDVLELLPRKQAQDAQAVLFYKKGKDIRVAAVQPNIQAVQDIVRQLEQKFGAEPNLYVVSEKALTTAIGRYRREKEKESQPQDVMTVTSDALSGYEQVLTDMKQLGRRIASMPPTEILEAITVAAVKMDASDIHIEPKENNARFRLRIDGVLQDITTFERQGWSLVLSRVKVLAGLKLNIHEAPQDGSFVLEVGDKIYDMRVSILPGGYGENIVIRLLDRESEAVRVNDLGMKQRDFDTVMRELQKANGMVLVTGPTGSGKTTTLASFIQEVNKPETKIITLEDPIEYRIKGVQQTQVNEDKGYTFAAGLRSILRQDPDIIMVGEMRDVETAETAIHASLTGHLVFSTLHTNDAAGAVPRLVDMGIKPFVIAPALNMVIAQRLVRVVCKQCAKSYTPSKQELATVRNALASINPDIFDVRTLGKTSISFMKAVGCDACGNTGYKGRIGVFEIFSNTGDIHSLILEASDSARIQKTALAQGMTTIAQDAYLKVIDGTTTIDEVKRVTSE